MVGVLSVTGFLALFAVEAVVAQSNTTMLEAFPECARQCALTSVEDAQCSLTSTQDMLNCFCTNITAQYELSTCAQVSCGDDVTSSGYALYLENQFCQAYPHPSRQNEINVIGIVTFAMSTPIVIARCLARYRLTSKLWPDDYLSVIATIVSAEKGFGLHMWNFNPVYYTSLLQLSYSGQLVYVGAQVSAKVAILVLYQRVFSVAGARWFRWSIVGCIGIMVVHGAVYSLILVFQCLPIKAVWDTSVTGAKCLDLGLIIFSGAIFSIVEDLVLMILPIPELRKLQVSGKKRIGVAIMFAVASLGTVASIVRLKYLITLDEAHDSTWNNVDVTIWSLIEVLCAVICGSLPALRPYVDPWNPRVTITWKSKGSRGSLKQTGDSTGQSDTSYSSKGIYDGAKIGDAHATLPFSPVRSNTPRTLFGGSGAPQYAQAKSTSQDQDVGPRPVRIYPEEYSSAESEPGLIIQVNRAPADHVKVSSTSRAGWRGGQAAGRSASVSDTRTHMVAKAARPQMVQIESEEAKGALPTCDAVYRPDTSDSSMTDFLRPASPHRRIARISSLDKLEASLIRG